MTIGRTPAKSSFAMCVDAVRSGTARRAPSEQRQRASRRRDSACRFAFVPMKRIGSCSTRSRPKRCPPSRRQCLPESSSWRTTGRFVSIDACNRPRPAMCRCRSRSASALPPPVRVRTDRANLRRRTGGRRLRWSHGGRGDGTSSRALWITRPASNCRPRRGVSCLISAAWSTWRRCGSTDDRRASGFGPHSSTTFHRWCSRERTPFGYASATFSATR